MEKEQIELIGADVLTNYLETLAKVSLAGHKVDREIAEAVKLLRISVGIEKVEDRIKKESASTAKYNFSSYLRRLTESNLLSEQQAKEISDEYMGKYWF